MFVCLLNSVRMSCRCNIFYRYIFTEVFNKTQRKKEFINSKGRQNRTADISRHCIDQGTFKETIKTQCMHYVRRVISSNIQHIMIEQIYSYKNGYSTFHHKTIFVWQWKLKCWWILINNEVYLKPTPETLDVRCSSFFVYTSFLQTTYVVPVFYQIKPFIIMIYFT